ncbi:ankyrin repeat and fibronectin type-III domain-containing protein 1 isoform X3 [Euwallacea fornicatus]|uniref:ankyrin repeat and fibronectin type-III domain-containing protein 1 isoform X3 n=1 Tax=Euwallacea fornicatus TaxID=995702 RepID=UPI00338EC02E
MEDRKHSTSGLTIDRAAFLILRVKKAFKKKKLQRKEREKNAQLAAARFDQRTSCVGLEGSANRRIPPPLLRSRTLPAIVVPGVNILQAQLGNYGRDQNHSPYTSKSGLAGRLSAARASLHKEDAASLENRRKSAISRLCGSGSYGPERSEDGSLILKVPSPHVVAARAYRMPTSPQPGPSTCGAFSKISKLLTPGSSKNQIVIDESNVIRRLSWERRDPLNNRLPRSSSIDSMVEAVWSETPISPSESPISITITSDKRTSLRPDKALGLMSPSVGRRVKGQRATNALFSAIECGHLEKAKTILESTDADVNSINSDLLSPLDIAVLSNNRSMAKMLTSFGAKDGNQFSTPEKLGSHLRQILCEAEMRLQELGGLLDEPLVGLNTRASFSSMLSAGSSSSMTGCAGGDTEKQAVAWSRKAKTLKRLVLGFTQARPPDVPSLVAADITGKNAVTIRLAEPACQDSPITTKFLVQWSTHPDFSIISGHEELTDMSDLRCQIELTQGRRYYFRACCGNLKGYGIFRTCTPSSVVPSTWRDIERRDPRFTESNHHLDQLIEEVRQFRPSTEMLESAGPNPQRRAQRKKTTIKQLFTAASKFQKNLKRGIYLACILYHEDKVLVTNEEFLPVIEVDESFPSCINGDLYWLMRVANTWDDTKCLKNVMEEHTSSTLHFRTKLLLAALQMQSSLCLQDLGQLYYKPLRDSQGTVVISTINYVKSPKSVSVLNSRWLPMNKVFKKTILSEDSNISDVLMASIQDQINYHQVSSLKLGRGLYLAYLKMQSSVDMIHLVVSAKTPNMLPHCKVRDNPHISAEEWEYLKQQHLPDILDNATELQRNFLELVTSAAKRLFNYMDITNEDANTHRLYDAEVIELIEEVSFIVICPPAEFSCAVPGQREILLQRGDLVSLPIQVFEMIHMNTYQSTIVQKYSKLSCLLELDAATASHLHREAFSNSELAVAKERLSKLQDLQNKLESIWKSVRWLADVITFARDKNMGCICMRYILEKEVGVSTSPKRDLLQLPPPKVIKTTPGRGSWPGPGATNMTPQTNLMSEYSKSEQHLNINGSVSHYLSACSDPDSIRKDSDSFTSASEYLSQLAPSRSEDVLFSVPASSSNRLPGASPMNIRPQYGGSMVSVNTLNTADSLHSLSSDSDPIGNSTPKKKGKPKMVPSKSMANVKQHFLGPTNEDHNVMFLTVDHAVPHKNLESSLSKSLTNIRASTDFNPEADSPNCPVVFPEIFNLPSDDPEPYAKDNYDILQIYAAYETGLVIGTSLKVYVTPRTTAREVVNVVVRQLNMAVILKGKKGPIYSRDMLKNFCLVAIIGARERCLRDDFKPLLLQNPWKLGRLYVRRKHDVLAALDHSSKLDRIETNRIDRI